MREYKQKKVVAVDPLTFDIKIEFNYPAEAANYFHITRQAINSAIQRFRRCSGFFLFYKDVYDSMFSTKELVDERPENQV